MHRVKTPIVFLLLFAWLPLAQAAPKAELWPHWQAHDAESTQTIDHSAWNGWLSQWVVAGVDGINRVAYQRVDPAARATLQAYIEQLAAVDIKTHNRDQQRAFWINLYNALTVEVILENFPLESIRDISSGFFSSGPWKLKLVEIDGKKLTLDDIEHRILRPIWRDARIHYAVNCASIGCPNLQRQAFTASNSETLLEKGAREFINHSRGAEVVDGKLEVSSIYDWFAVDFGDSDRDVIEHLREYADDRLKQSLEGIERISDDSYDWRLNLAQDS